MKKIMLLMMAALAITMVSCKKAGPDEGEDETKIPVPTYRVKALMKSWEGDDKQSGDMYTYTWNADGTIASVDMAWAKEVYAERVIVDLRDKVGLPTYYYEVQLERQHRNRS